LNNLNLLKKKDPGEGILRRERQPFPAPLNLPNFIGEKNIAGTPSRFHPLLSAERGGKRRVERGIVIFLARR
jgi:hypothetical protein